jgi:hypothetical protein
MDETVVKVVGAGLFTVLGTVIGWWFKERRFKAKRYREREQSFEKAQEGYRPCYRKFSINLAAAHGVATGFREKDSTPMQVDFSVLQENFLEAKGCNDPIVVEELDAFWPAEVRERGELPPKSIPASLDAAMRDHGSRTLEEHEKLIASRKKCQNPVGATPTPTAS